ncbi:hypothetical protein [Prosthecomicrobium pneumaticum]|uniref:Uncharacterized membrane-anchored protein YhcB (DUF1043 family) n=1 Tax=Prosthecomicrobium pneumaticum TaxID=81895 RepID=A0A7W9FMN1_9HYPH|nr:hypothetical protein [Prosthecomicrobium pneumaticum]MBB5753498.1 uncharacterized membrane-anchored protein YhcB (DUF1043 family) [Prosthecomicrobium pneumaticum]
MNLKIVLLVVGLVAGALVGWVATPSPSAEMRVGGVEIAVDQNQVAVGPEGTIAESRTSRIALFAAIGAVIGLGIGFVADRRR